VSAVLLIDDEPDMGQLVSLCLRDKGARVVQATNLAEALASARTEKPNVVLLDLGLGEEDGLGILPRLREEPDLADVPFVVFSVHQSRRSEALEHGAAGFVAKPFKAASLREALEHYLV
jgi:CheY-like chemotaxis protein